MVSEISVRSVTIGGINNLEYLQGLASGSPSDHTLEEAASFFDRMPNSGVELEVVNDDGRATVRAPLSSFLGARDLTPRPFVGAQARSTEEFVDGPVLGFADQLLGRDSTLLRRAEFTPEVRPTSLKFGANPSFAMFYGVMPNFELTGGEETFDWETFQDAYLIPYGYVPSHILEPGRHYGLQFFEGMKVYIQPDGRLALFRPERNARRMADSARRLVMQRVREDALVNIAKRVARANRHLLPPPGFGSAYIRPVAWGSGAGLGVQAPGEVAFGMTCTPVGPYFAGPLGLVVQDQYMRSGPKLTGDRKVGPNYAGGIKAAKDLAKSQEFTLGNGSTHHFSEILYTDADGNFQEAGAANVFFITKDGTIVTPPLNDQILPGITRDSVIRILRKMGYTVDDTQPINKRRLEAGDFVGAFATGTAAVVTSVAVIRVNQGTGYKDYFFSDDGSAHPVAAEVHDRLTGIQEGRYEDEDNWMDFI